MTGTDTNLINKKVVIDFDLDGRFIIATVDRLSYTYPKTAYSVTWTKADNPGEFFPPDCERCCSIIHFSQIRRYL